MKHSSPDLFGIMHDQRAPIRDGAALRDQGIARAEAHADQNLLAKLRLVCRGDAVDGVPYVHNDTPWTGLAAAMLHYAMRAMDRFQTADFRKWAENRGLPPPPDARAYGGIIKRAVKAGLIVADGYAPTQDPIAHNRPAVVWKAVR